MTAYVVCRFHHRILGLAEERDGRLVFVRRDGADPVDLDRYGTMFPGFVECRKCPSGRQKRIIPAAALKQAAKARGRDTRILV